MYVLHLELVHFRNYRALSLDLHPGTTVFVGDNGQGKTNLLEAVAVLALGKSFRTPRDDEWRMWGEDRSLIRAEVVTARGSTELELSYDGRTKTAKAGGVTLERLQAFVGRLGVVLFVPEDLALIGGAPKLRRRFFDLELAQRKPRYLYHLSRYNKILLQRNRLLKDETDAATKASLLEAYDPLLAESGAYVMHERARFVERIAPHAEAIYGALSGGRERLGLRYVTAVEPEAFAGGVEDVEAVFRQKLAESRERDIIRRQSLIGVHRDDLLITIDGRPAETHASQGQRRSAALALKLAEAAVAREDLGEPPVVLLDDVLSELDPRRQAALLEHLDPRAQTLITTAALETFSSIRRRLAVYAIKGGAVVPPSADFRRTSADGRRPKTHDEENR